MMVGCNNLRVVLAGMLIFRRDRRLHLSGVEEVDQLAEVTQDDPIALEAFYNEHVCGVGVAVYHEVAMQGSDLLGQLENELKKKEFRGTGQRGVILPVFQRILPYKPKNPFCRACGGLTWLAMNNFLAGFCLLKAKKSSAAPAADQYC